jgi:hypothetical protein
MKLFHRTMVSTCVAWKIHTTNIQGKRYHLSAMSSSDPVAQLTYFPWLRWESASPGIFQAPYTLSAQHMYAIY